MLALSLFSAVGSAAVASEECEGARQQLDDARVQYQSRNSQQADWELKRLSEGYNKNIKEDLAEIHNAFLAEIEALKPFREDQAAPIRNRWREKKYGVIWGLQSQYHEERSDWSFGEV